MKLKIIDKRKKVDREGIISDALSRIPPAEEMPDSFAIPPLEDQDEGLDNQDSIALYDKSDEEHHEVKLDQLLRWMKGKISKEYIVAGGNSSNGGGTVKVYDLSSQLDGSTTTFALPAFWRVLTVDLSSTPRALRPDVDFTVDGTAMTITFTSQIRVASSLSAGQTCIVTYAE